MRKYLSESVSVGKSGVVVTICACIAKTANKQIKKV